jgi:glycosyltransferase involved in cell wall biosynthesis
MKPATPLVSVIIPAYNCARLIDETLRSVYKQTYTNWEIILIDDGSTDDTKAVLAPHMNRIRYYFQRNQGTAAARNAGLQMARGELFAFLDNDDIWLPEKLDLQVRAIQTWRDCGLVFTDGKTFDESGVLRDSLISRHLDGWIHEHATIDPLIAKGWLSQEFFLKNHISSASSVLVQKACIEAVGGFDERIAVTDDYDLWLRIAQRFPIALILSCLYMWRWREDSQSGPLVRRQHRWNEAAITVLEKHWPNGPPEIRAAVRTRLSELYWSCGWAYFDEKRFHESRKMFLKCLHYNKVFVPAVLSLVASHFSPSFIDGLRSVKRQLSRSWQGTLGANIHR